MRINNKKLQNLEIENAGSKNTELKTKKNENICAVSNLVDNQPKNVVTLKEKKEDGSGKIKDESKVTQDKDDSINLPLKKLKEGGVGIKSRPVTAPALSSNRSTESDRAKKKRRPKTAPSPASSADKKVSNTVSNNKYKLLVVTFIGDLKTNL